MNKKEINKKIIVISAINIFQGGALSILKDCCHYLDNNLSDQYSIIAYVHDVSLLSVKNIKLIPVEKSRRNYFYRLYYEYIWFNFHSKKIKPYLWLSLHDITPNVTAEIRSVYCHNPSPFYKISLKEFLLEPTFGLFNSFYKYLYRININKNKYIIVQQNWLRNNFKSQLKAKSEIIVARPNIIFNGNNNILDKKDTPFFFYPTFPRVFKNIEVLCEAAKILNSRNLKFELQITISGNENKYSRYVYDKYKNIPNVNFIGILTREQVYKKYSECSALVFPSKLETWGLPISEAKEFHIPILSSDLPYSHETAGDYDKISFFDENNSIQLADLLEKVLNKKIKYDGNTSSQVFGPCANNWKEIFDLLLIR